MQKTELFSTATTPYKGLNSDRHPLTLTPGEAYDAKNIRAEPGMPITLRNGIGAEAGTTGIPANSIFWGASELVKIKDDFWMLYIAIEETADSKIHIYNKQYTAGAWGSTWYELTASSGQFGDTLMSLPAEGRVIFTTVESDPDARSHLIHAGPITSVGPVVIVQNGIENALHILGHDDASVVGDRLVPIVPIDAPTKARSSVVQADVLDSVAIADVAINATAKTGTSFLHVKKETTVAPNYWEWKTNASGIAVGDYGEITLTSDTLTMGGSRSCPQIGFIIETDDDSWWDCVDVWVHIDIGSGFAWERIHNPNGTVSGSGANATNNRVHVETSTSGYVVSAYAYPSKDGQMFNIYMDGVRLTVNSTKLAVSSYFRIRWIYASGRVPGTAQYVISRISSLNEAESAGVALASGSFGQETGSLREKWLSYRDGTTLPATNCRSCRAQALGAAVPTDFVFPIDPQLFYKYLVPSLNSQVSEIDDTFCDTWAIYRKDPGDSDFYLAMRDHQAIWSAGVGWFHVNGPSPKYGATYYVEDVTYPEDKIYSKRAPDAFNEVTPIGTAATYANKRHYVAVSSQDPSGSNIVGNSIKISEEGSPGRFRSLVKFDGNEVDPSSGYEARVGIEEVKSLLSIEDETTEYGTTSVHCITDRSVYAIVRGSGDVRLFNLRRVSPFGTQSKHAFTDANGSVMWLDHERTIRSSANRSINLSHLRVQDKLDAITDGSLDIACATFCKNRAYFSYSVNTDNDRVLVYNTESGIWESEDQFPAGKAPAQFVSFILNGQSRMLFFAPDCTLYELEKSGQLTDDGSDISLLLETGEFSNRMFEPIVAQHFALVGTPVQTVLATKRIFSEPAATVTGELDLDTGTTLAWKYDTLSGGGTPGGEGQSVRLQISGDFDAAFELLALTAEIEGADLGGPSE